MRASPKGSRIAIHALPGLLALALAAAAAPVLRARAAARRRRGERPAIVWGPVPIANLRSSVLADRLMGYRSEAVVYRPYRPTDAAAFDHVFDLPAPVVRQLVPYAAFLWALLRYDVFCFYFDGGLLGPTPFWRAELPLLRLAGKRIVAWPYGGDARLASRTRAHGGWNAYSEVPAGEEDRREEDVRERLDAFGRWANAILGCADLVEDLPRLDGVLPYPFDERRWEPVPPPDDGVVRVVHAPNHRHYKGTRHVLAAVEQLRAEGEDVELVLVEGLSSEEARRAYERADVVVDQLLIGAYALFAIEAMALGKPVVCYLNDRFRPFHPEWEECPIVSATPDTIVEELRRLVRDPALREELARRGPAYVREHHSLEIVGRRLDAVYRGLWRTPAAAREAVQT
jgi:hypothetical protein